MTWPPSAALATLSAARADAEACGRADLLLRTEGMRGNVLSRLGKSREGIAAVRAALDQAPAGTLSDTTAELQQRLADSLEHSGDYRATTAAYAAAYQFCDVHGADAMGQLGRACATAVLFTRGGVGPYRCRLRRRPRLGYRAAGPGGGRRLARPGERDARRDQAGTAAAAGKPAGRHQDRAHRDGAALGLGPVCRGPGGGRR